LLLGQVISKELIVKVVLTFFVVRAILIIVTFGEHLLSVFVVPIEDSQGGDQIEHELLVSFNVDDFVVNKVEGLKLF
jgi:hypothetical protein